MRPYLYLLFGIALVLTSCTKDEDDEGYRAAGIVFRSEAGYTATDDTVGVNDTLRIGAIVAEGSERLRTVYVQMAVDGGAWIRKDSINFTANPTTVEIQAIMGDSPATETWSVLAVERNGDSTRRSLVFTVTE